MKTESSRGLVSPDRVVPQTYFDVILRHDGIVWLRRSEVVYPSVRDVHRAYDDFLAVADDWLLERRIKSGELGTKTKTAMSWLYDVRSAPTRRADPEFEEVVQARRADLLDRSAALAVLVRTAAGRMQVTRLARTANAAVVVFDDFDEAIRWLGERMKPAPK